MAFLAAAVPAAISAAGSIAGGILGRKQPEETKIQKTQRNLVDQLLASLGGNGPYSGLFKADEDTFQKSFVEPAMARFRNQTAPQIQQQYIASGQHRGTGLEDTLGRAGVELDQLLNQQYAQYQQNAQNRQASALNSILGMGAGGSNGQSFGNAVSQGAAGYLSSSGFGSDISNILDSYKSQQSKENPPQSPVVRRGYEVPTS